MALAVLVSGCEVRKPADITLDGDLSDWEGLPLVSMGNPDKTQISFAASSDGNFIYFMANVIFGDVPFRERLAYT